MNKLSILSIAILLAGLFACNPMKKIETTQTSAYSAYQNGNFTEALTMYDQLMKLYKEQSKDVPYDIIVKAGKAAFNAKNFEKAKEYLSKAFEGNKTYEILNMLIDTYKQLDETGVIKKLITDNIPVFQKAGKTSEAYTELFKMSYSAGDLEEAYKNYNKISDPAIDLFPEYLTVLNDLGKKDEAQKACETMLVKDANSVPALEWLAVNEYNKAEEWYKKEIAKYNKNKNATTYAYLRRDLKKISAIFRSARDKFLKLRKLDPNNKSYIKYLKNTYLRLDMKDKAKEMDDLLK